MKAVIEGSYIKLDISDLVNHMDEECRKVFYQEIVFEEKLLEACMDFLVSNYAFADSYHSTSYGKIISRLGDRLKEKCLPLMDQAAQELIKNLTSDLKYKAEEEDKWRNYAWQLERDWPELRYYGGQRVSEEEAHAMKLCKIHRPQRPWEKK